MGATTSREEERVRSFGGSASASRAALHSVIVETIAFESDTSRKDFREITALALRLVYQQELGACCMAVSQDLHVSFCQNRLSF